jgi:hypothetical protein
MMTHAVASARARKASTASLRDTLLWSTSVRASIKWLDLKKGALRNRDMLPKRGKSAQVRGFEGERQLEDLHSDVPVKNVLGKLVLGYRKPGLLGLGEIDWVGVGNIVVLPFAPIFLNSLAIRE